jgi:predicted nucleotide-binding protein
MGPTLTAEREAFLGVLEQRISIGDGLVSTSVVSEAQYEHWSAEIDTWDEYNTEVLRRSFDSEEVALAYATPSGPHIASSNVAGKVDRRRSRLKEHVRSLRSIADRIDFYAPASEDVDAGGEATAPARTSDGPIFIVHGRRDEIKIRVARFLENSTDRAVIILHEQPGAGRTIIEKFEDYAGASSFAVVLLTADDVGGLAGGPQRPRARQNVVFEFGFFVGSLGRRRVAVLKEIDLEEPSDLAGVSYISVGSGDGWQIALAKELRANGIETRL